MNKTTRWSALALISAMAIGFVGTAADAQTGERRRDRQEQREDRREERRDDSEATRGWTRLGERTVNAGVDHDTIAVTAAQGRYSRVMFRVANSSAQLHDVVITFADGTTFSPTTRLNFSPGETTRSINLPGDARAIRQVDFKVENLPSGGRAQFELWAR